MASHVGSSFARGGPAARPGGHRPPSKNRRQIGHDPIGRQHGVRHKRPRGQSDQGIGNPKPEPFQPPATSRRQCSWCETEDTLQTQLSAWQNFNSEMLTLQSAASALSTSANFNTKTVSSSDSSVVTATATSSASNGTYYVKVSGIAQSEQLSSQGFANTTDAIGTGSVNISFHNGTNFSVDINSNNDSLSGLCDAINNADSGVSAQIVNTGDPDTPYKLLLTSTNTGEDYAMTVTTSGLSGGTTPTIDQVVQNGTDAHLQLGTGSGQINIEKSSNTISDVIPGVTLNLAGADTNTTVMLQVQADTSTMEQSIQSLVTAYNAVASDISTQFTYNTSTQTGGTLFGSYQLQTIQSQLRSALNSQVSGLSGKRTNHSPTSGSPQTARDN